MPGAGDRTIWALAGRDEELALVVEWLRSPEPRPVVLSGAAGVGKSRLAAEACAAVAGDLTVEWCAATRSAASIPFGPVTHLLAPGNGTGRRADALRDALAAIGRRPDTVLVAVDDAHLLDGASAALVHALATSGRAGVLLTRRSGEPTPDPISAICQDDATRYLELQPLSHDETAQLLADALDGPVETQTIDRLWALTGGNLLFLRELVRALQDEGALTVARGLWRWRGTLSAAPRLSDVLNARLDRLDAAERDALTMLAYAEPLPLPILRQLVDGDALARLGAYGLVVVEGLPPSSTARLAHPLYAELLRAGLSPLEEVEASRRVVEAALEVPDAAVPHARWVSAWALEAGVELPVGAVVDAAREALRATDAPRAAQLARIALAREHAAEPACLLGESLFVLERHEEAAAAFRDAAEIASDDAMRARIAMGAINALSEGLGRSDDAMAVFKDALATISDPFSRDLVAAQLALTLAHSGNRREAARIALPLLDSPDERVRLRALSPAAVVLIAEGQVDVVLAASNEAMEPAIRLRDQLPSAPGWVVSTHVTALVAAGELQEAHRYLDLVDGLSGEVRGEYRAFLALGRGRIALLEGRPATATQHLRNAASGLDDADVGGRKVWALSLLAEACALLGDAEGAARASHEGAQATHALIHHFDGDSERARAWEHVAAGLVSKAHDTLLDVARRNRPDAPMYELLALHDVVRLGDASGVVDRIEELARQVDGHFPPVFLAHTRALCDRDGAGLDAASESFEALGLDLLGAEAAAEAVAVWRGRADRGRTSLSAAHAARLLARCEGASTPALRPLDEEPGPQLTRREREIADLASRGLTSSAIADQLVVSVRTVDNHLQRVYTKLGIKSRNELASLLDGGRSG